MAKRQPQLSTQVPRTKSIPLQIATMMSMIEYEIEQYNGYKFVEKSNFHKVPSELQAKWH